MNHPDPLNLKINLDSIGSKVQADYIDGDIVIVDDLRSIPTNDPLQIDMIIILLCTCGRARVDINGRHHMVERLDMVVLPPNVYVENYLLSPDFACKIIGLSYSRLQRMLHVNRDLWDMVIRLSSQPVFHVSDNSAALLASYYSLLKLKLEQPQLPYRREVLHALFEAIFYDLSDFIRLHTPVSPAAERMKQGDLLVKRFLRLLADAQGTQRSVGFFAHQLCVTPKYLSSVCRQSTGRSAKAWIIEYTAEILSQHLKYSDLSIKEIAERLGFPNLAVFGKFVRACLGMSPSDFRRSLAPGHHASASPAQE